MDVLAGSLIDGFSRSFDAGAVIELFVFNLIATTIIGLLVIYPLWRVFARVGFAPSLSLLVFIPYFGGLIILGLLAFGRWPAAERNHDSV